MIERYQKIMYEGKDRIMHERIICMKDLYEKFEGSQQKTYTQIFARRSRKHHIQKTYQRNRHGIKEDRKVIHCMKKLYELKNHMYRIKRSRKIMTKQIIMEEKQKERTQNKNRCCAHNVDGQ